MTLAIGLISQEHAVLVADRRLTDARSGRLLDDNRNKTILLCGHFLIAYSGLAEIAGAPTDEWVGKLLVDVEPSEAFEVLATEAGAALRGISNRSLRRHAFLAVGFTRVRDRPDEGHLPCIVSVANALDVSLEWLTEAEDQFTIRARGLGPNQLTLGSWVGQSIPLAETNRLKRNADAYSERVTQNPNGLARLLIEQVRRVADRNAAVGRNLLVAGLPKSAVPTTAYDVPLERSGGLSADSLTCLYVPDASKPDQALFYGPMSVCRGLQIRGVEVWTGKPPWWKE